MATLEQAKKDIRAKRGLDEAPVEEAVVAEPVGEAEPVADEPDAPAE
jgi:hypothetical protein